MALLLSPVPSGAQPPDLLFGAWSFRPRELPSRPAGLAGAYVALADSVRAVEINPAGLPLVPRAELSASSGGLWSGAALTIRPKRPLVPLSPDCGRRSPRPWAVAAFLSQDLPRRSDLEAVLRPGLAETGRLEATMEHIGVGMARGVFPWLTAGVTLEWRHLRFDGRASEVDLAGHERARVMVAADSNKIRTVAGLLAAFGPTSSPTAFRLGVAWQGDLKSWSLERTRADRVAGVVTGPTSVTLAEPAVVSGGAAWRISDVWTVTLQGDHVSYRPVRRALAEVLALPVVTLPDAFEPRAGIEATFPAPFGGYLKLRVGARRESTGRLRYEGSDPVLTQAFRPESAVFRAAAGASVFGEFYDKGFRLDVDTSQVLLVRSLSLAAAGTRRFSLGVTVRL